MKINRIHVLELEQDNTSLQAFQINDANETVENAFAYGTEVEAIAPSSQAFGTQTQAGCLGYYISAITKDSIYLSREKVSPKAYLRKNDTPEELAEENKIIAQCYQENFNSGLPNETFICHIQANGYYQWPFITVSLGKAYNEKTNSNRLSYDYMNTIPQSSQKYWFQDTKDPSHDKRKVQPHILYCLEAPMAGVVPVGNNSIAQGAQTIASADESHAEGCLTKAVGRYAHAEGGGTQAGYAAHSEGYLTKAKGFYSHAEGKETEAKGSSTHAEGEGTIATLNGQHVQGRYNIEDTKQEYAHIVGWGSKTQRKNIHTLKTNGDAQFAGKIEAKEFIENGKPLASKDWVEQNYQSLTDGGYATKADINTIETTLNTKPGIQQLVTSSSGSNTYEGYTNDFRSHKETTENAASYNLSELTGVGTFAEGFRTNATGNLGSHAEGYYTTASGTHGSHAEGRSTEASGQGSHAEGWKTTAASKYQHVQGRYNIEDANNTYAHIVGNGEKKGNTETYSNAHTLDWDGNAWFKGRIQCGGDKWNDSVVGRVPCVFEGETEPSKLTGNYNNGDLYFYTTSTTGTGNSFNPTINMYSSNYDDNWTDRSNANDTKLYLGYSWDGNFYYGIWAIRFKIQIPESEETLHKGSQIIVNSPATDLSNVQAIISTNELTRDNLINFWYSTPTEDYKFVSNTTKVDSNNTKQIKITLTEEIENNTNTFLYIYLGHVNPQKSGDNCITFNSDKYPTITYNGISDTTQIITQTAYMKLLDSWIELGKNSKQISNTTPS